MHQGARNDPLSSSRPAPAGRGAVALVLAAACAGLFALYLCQSRTGPFNSDGAANVLQARAIIGGNPLLRGWWTSDVSFYTTELPEYTLVTAIRGVTPDVVHWCGALSYTLTVLLTAQLARGRAGWCGAAVTAGIMLAPGILGGTEVFLENPDHAGTAVPVLALLLLLDWAGQRRYLPWAVALLLALAQTGDELTLAAATVPLCLVCTTRLVAGRRNTGRLDGGRLDGGRLDGARLDGARLDGARLDGARLDGARLDGGSRMAGGLNAGRLVAGGEGRRDVALVAAAAGSVVLARLAELALRALGGFDLRPLGGVALASPGSVPANARMLWQSLILLFGANQPGTPHQAQTVAAHPFLVGMAALHVIGLVLAGAGLVAGVAAVAARRADRVTAVIVVAVLALAAAGLFSTLLRSLSNAHEVAILLPLCAALAGRMLPALAGRVLPALADRVLAGRVRPVRPSPAVTGQRPDRAAVGARTVSRVILACWLVAGLTELGYAASWPAAQSAQQAVAAWLAAEHQDEGLAGYWQAAATTVASGGRVLVAPIVLAASVPGQAGPAGHAGQARPAAAEADRWESSAAWYRPDQRAATFVIAVADPSALAGGLPAVEVRARFGPPAAQHRIGPEVIMLYRYNLLTRLAGTGFPGLG